MTKPNVLKILYLTVYMDDTLTYSAFITFLYMYQLVYCGQVIHVHVLQQNN